MEIVLTGLDESACKSAVGAALWCQDTVDWRDPDSFLLAAQGEAAAHEADRKYIWFYRSPFALASQVIDGGATENLQAELDIWLKRNVAALNLRRYLGKSLLLVNADATTPGDLQVELGGTRQPAVRDRAAQPTECSADHVTEEIIAVLFHTAAPRHCEVFDMLEAAAWSLPSRPATLGMRATPCESQLFLLLDLARRGAPSSGASKEEIARLAMLLEVEQAAVAEARQAAAAAQRAMAESRQAAECEESRLVERLHKVQEDLEQSYLENLDLRRSLDAERDAATAARPEPKAPSAKPRWRGVARIMPHWGRSMWERLGAERRIRVSRDAISRSEWFDRDWYLEAYPDVKKAGVDPAKHYVEFGWKEGRNPGPAFDTGFYLASNPDVAKSGMNPLRHFLEFGLSEGRLPSNKGAGTPKGT